MNVRHPVDIAAKPLMSERRVSLIGAMIVALGPVSMALYTPAMPEIVAVFGSSEAAVKMTLSLYFAGFAVAQLVCGPLSDGFGRRPVLLAFLAIYTAASLMALFAPTIELLILARFSQGVGAAAGVAIARAIVRDLFTHESSARIMNLIGLMLALGPALAPTLGGLSMEYFGWQSVFVLMLVAGLGIILAIHLTLRETVTRDTSRIRPAALARSYATLLRSPYFMATSLAIAGALGALYTQATVLPFILMQRVGLSPSEFGLGMLMQSGSFFMGALTVRGLMPRLGSQRLVPIGLTAIGIGSAFTATLLHIYQPTFLIVMLPVAVYTFGIAFVMPAMSTAALAPFPHIAGAAASLMGFFQMGSGLVGGMIAALFGDPVIALTIVIPAFGVTAIASWLVWRMLPAPAATMAPRQSPGSGR